MLTRVQSDANVRSPYTLSLSLFSLPCKLEAVKATSRHCLLVRSMNFVVADAILRRSKVRRSDEGSMGERGAGRERERETAQRKRACGE